jgi:hypothetical protein
MFFSRQNVDNQALRKSVHPRGGLKSEEHSEYTLSRLAGLTLPLATSTHREPASIVEIASPRLFRNPLKLRVIKTFHLSPPVIEALLSC